MFEAYRRSLKHPEAEELFDLWFYRPLGWLFVRAVHRTPITPNQVTVLSLAASLAAAWLFATGDLEALAAAAAWYALANILDCADGQLARTQGSGTPYGRIVDGVADYIGTTAIFLGIGAGFTSLGMNLWFEVVAAGLSSALHAAVFDQRQSAFIASRRAAAGGAASAPTAAAAPPTGAHRVAGTLNAAYERVQAAIMRPLSGGSAALAGPEGETLIRIWSFLGPTTNRTALIAFALIGRVDLFLWAVIVPGNLWLAGAWFLQRRVEARSPHTAGAAE